MIFPSLEVINAEINIPVVLGVFSTLKDPLLARRT
jgi:hypothetical protein